MLNVIEMKLPESDADSLLKEALEMGFESVIILGFKNSQMHIKSSAAKSRLEVLGAIEEGKNHFLNA